MSDPTADTLDTIDTAAAQVERRLGISRRDFAQFCAATASTLGLLPEAGAQIAKAVEKARRPSVIWLH